MLDEQFFSKYFSHDENNGTKPYVWSHYEANLFFFGP